MKNPFRKDADDTPGAPPEVPAPPPGGGWSGMSSNQKIAVVGVGIGTVLAVCMWPSTPKPVPPTQQDAARDNPGKVQDVDDSPPAATTVASRFTGAIDPPAPPHRRRRPAPTEMALYSENAVAAVLPGRGGATPRTAPGADGAPPAADTAPVANQDRGGEPSALDRQIGGATRQGTEHATLVSNPSYLIRAGDVIPCLPIEAENSSLPGYTSCRVNEWYRSTDQRRGLLPPGTRIFGQIKTGLAAGQTRLGVLYTLIETPHFNQTVNAPAADAMGRAGEDGDVKTFFWDKLGAVALYSLLDVSVGAGQNLASSSLSRAFGNGSGTTLNLGQQSQSLGSQEFGATINRAPVLTRDQALPIAVMVGQDLDFTHACTLAAHVDPMACPLL